MKFLKHMWKRMTEEQKNGYKDSGKEDYDRYARQIVSLRERKIYAKINTTKVQVKDNACARIKSSSDE